MKFVHKVMVIILIFSMAFSQTLTTLAESNDRISTISSECAEYLLKTVSDPTVATVGGEWTILGLERLGYKALEDYFNKYYMNVEKITKDSQGILHHNKYTEYSRVVIALTAIGKDPANVGGYNILEPLGDFDKVIWQGINGPVFALIALDSGNYDMPVCTAAKTQATREMYIDEILSRQLPDGGFALSGDKADPDITGMVLQALANYQDRKNVKAAADKALVALSSLQDASGGFRDKYGLNSESVSQVLMALCELGIDINDARFVKNDRTLLDSLLTFYTKGEGFVHSADDKEKNLMSTEQALCALASLDRVSAGRSSLYKMADKKTSLSKAKDAASSESITGLPNKHKDVMAMPVTGQAKSFTDIEGYWARHSIEDLASRGIISGVSASAFAPEKTITRAEFAAIAIKALGLAPKATGKFQDVPGDKWYAPFVDTAYSYGIINGASASAFLPDNDITRQEAAVIISNAGKLCGLQANFEAVEIKDILAQFPDYIKSAEWARNGLAFCYKENILSQDSMLISPLEPVNRGEIADMLYRLLKASNLL